MRKLLLIPILCGAVAIGPASASSSTKVLGTVGPGFTISLKSTSGKKLTSLKAGTYMFVVSDKSAIHNFTVKGPGVSNRTITGTSFVGTKTATLTLKAGKYTLYCTVHPTSVTTTITVK